MSTEAKTEAKPSFKDQLIALGVIVSDAPAKEEVTAQKLILASKPDEKQHLARVALTDLVESPTNPRRKWGDMDGLAATIEVQDVLEPILVRPVGTPNKGPSGKYEIVAGHRRFRGAKKAGKKDVPCLVRDLTDAQVAEVQAIENGQRKDLHAMEEAEGYGNLLRQGYTVPTIATKVGKSTGHVYAHLKVLELSPESKQAFVTTRDDGSAVLDLSVAIPLARYPHDVQAEALKQLTKPGRFYSSREMVTWLQREFCRHLKGAPFSLKDDALPVVKAETGAQPAGACHTCPRNTRNHQPDLLRDFDKAAAAGPGICTHVPCFEARAEQALKVKAEKAEADGVEVLSAEASAKALAYGSDFVRLDEVEHAHPKKFTRRQIVNALPDDKRPDVVMATEERDGVAKPVMLVKTNALRKAVVDATGAKWADKSSKPVDDYAQKQNARLKRVKLEREVSKAVLQQVVTKALDKGLSLPHLRAQAASVLERYHSQRIQPWQLLGLENERALAGWVEKARASDLQVLIFACHGASCWLPEYQPGYDDSLKKVADHDKIDVKALERELAPKKKAAAKKEKKAAAKS